MNVEKGQIWGDKKTGETVKILKVIDETVVIKHSSLGTKMSVSLSEFEREEIVLLENKNED